MSPTPKPTLQRPVRVASSDDRRARSAPTGDELDLVARGLVGREHEVVGVSLGELVDEGAGPIGLAPAADLVCGDDEHRDLRDWGLICDRSTQRVELHDQGYSLDSNFGVLWPECRAAPADNLAGVSDPVILATQQNDASFEDVWEELVWRGLVHVSTDQAALEELLADEPIT